MQTTERIVLQSDGKVFRETLTSTEYTVDKLTNLFAIDQVRGKIFVTAPIVGLPNTRGLRALVSANSKFTDWFAVQPASLNFCCDWTLDENKLRPVFPAKSEGAVTPLNPGSMRLLEWPVPERLHLWIYGYARPGSSEMAMVMVNPRTSDNEVVPGYYRLPIPNQFDDGRFCCDTETDVPGWADRVGLGLDILRNSPWNSDLFAASKRLAFPLFFSWDLEGTPGPVTGHPAALAEFPVEEPGPEWRAALSALEEV